MSERPCQPFYKPYGMTDEECEYKQRIAAEKLEQWKQEQNESNLLGAPVMPCALVMVTEPQPNGGVGHYFLVRDYNDKYYQTLRIQHRVRFVTNPTLLEKSGCKIILHKA